MTQKTPDTEKISDEELARAGEEALAEKDRTLSLEELKTIKLSNGFEKPVFEKNTKAEVTEVEVKVSTRSGTDSNGKQYTPIYFTIRAKVGDVETVDNYGGLRYYSENDRYWVGEKSDAGKLKEKVCDMLGKPDVTLSEVKEFLEGKEIQLKTETRSFQGNDTQKNIIQAIL
jgi:hypothetical protein